METKAEIGEPVTSPEEKIPPQASIGEELVLLTRGFFSLPILSGLGKLSALDRMLSKPKFEISDFSNIPNQKLLACTFEYLVRIGLLDYANTQKNLFKASELGREIFRRVNSFYAPHSYREYMVRYFEQLQNSGPYQKQSVDRLENIIGSGKTHERYFPPAVSFLKRKIRFEILADIGCGDGHFLSQVLKGVPKVKAAGIDLSEISVTSTRENLRRKYPQAEIVTFCADASDIPSWSQPLLQFVQSRSLVISMWFLLHEISHRDPENVVRFLTEVHRRFPKSSLIVGELVRQRAELLARHRKELLMPEYLLFHDLSEQGVLSWQEYQGILKKIPYELAAERVFDEISDGQGPKEPATFVWCLSPK